MSKISADNISNKDDTKEIPTDTIIAGSAKAWVNFNGTGVVAIRDNFNVSSITDVGVGVHTVNFTNNMPDTNYCVNLQTGRNTSGQANTGYASITVSGFTITSYYLAAVVDEQIVNAAVFSN